MPLGSGGLQRIDDNWVGLRAPTPVADGEPAVQPAAPQEVCTVHVHVCVRVCVCVLVCVLVCDDDDDDGVGVLSAGLMFKSITKLRANKTSVGGEEKGGWQSQAKPVCACVNAGKLLSCLLEYVVEENQESSWALRDVATDLTRCSCSHVCEST